MEQKKKKIILLLILINAFLFRLPGFFFPHQENDEVIYQELIKKTTFKFSDYNLQGTAILAKLPKINYDFPVFHHPPLFIFLEALVLKSLGNKWLMLIPLFSSLLTIWLTYKIGEKIYGEETGLIAAVILSICPISFFVATKIWIDSLLPLLIALTVYFSLKINQDQYFALLSGLSFTLALMTKYSSVFILPTILLMMVFKIDNWRKRLKSLLYFSLPLVLILPWFIYNYQKLGYFIQNQRSSEEGSKMFPFVNLVTHRPVYFYFSQTVMLFPFYLLPLIKMFKTSFLKRNVILLSWVLSFLIFLTIYGMAGGTYQMRYLAPLFPALAILTAVSLPKMNNLLLIGLLITSIYALLTSLFNSYVFMAADLIPLINRLFSH